MLPTVTFTNSACFGTLLCLGLVGCSSGSNGTNAGAEAGADAGFFCTHQECPDGLICVANFIGGPFVCEPDLVCDGGLSSLTIRTTQTSTATVTTFAGLQQLCATGAVQAEQVLLDTTPCGGFLFAGPSGVDNTVIWVFDATTGAYLATYSEGEDPPACVSGTATIPPSCIGFGGNIPCAATDAGPSDASTD